MFVGRNAEMQFLNRYFVKEGSQILVIYGAKGIGKTRLLQEFTADKENFYYAARACSDREQRYQWACELKEAGYDLPLYPEYTEIFGKILAEKAEKQVLVLDEFQYLVKGEGQFFQELVRFLENRRMSRPVLAVLLSSAAGWVENSMVERLGGAAAYLSGFFKVRELTFPEIRAVFPTYNPDDFIRNYAVIGGIPGFWMNFSEKLTAKENMVQNILTKESRLYGEMSVYLVEELREPAVYNTILAALARGCSKLNDIYLHTGFPRAKISVYLKNLMELDLVEKIYAGVYRITNSYVRFYFRFLFPHLGQLNTLSPEAFYEKEIAEEFPAFAEEGYRQICRQMFREELPEGFTVSEWAGRNQGLDLVAVDGDNRRVAGLCSYGRELTGKDYKELLLRAKKAKIQVDRVLFYGEAGFDRELWALAEQGKVELRSITQTQGTEK